MTNLATVLKTEVSRLARKEVRAHTDGLKKAISGYRTEIASLKKRVADPRLLPAARAACLAAK